MPPQREMLLQENGISQQHQYGAVMTNPSAESEANAQRQERPSMRLYASDKALRLSSSSLTSSLVVTKSIGLWGSWAIAVNSLTGPAMLEIPATFQRSGIIPTTAVLLGVCWLSAQCSLHMADVISQLPGNQTFLQPNVEYSDAFFYFWGRRWFILTHLFFFGCVTCLNISSIVDTAQVVDVFLGNWVPHGTWALRFVSPNEGWIQLIRWDPQQISCDQEDCSSLSVPFQNVLTSEGEWILTLGYLVVAIIFAPLGCMDLKENAAWQLLGFVVLLVTSAQFAINFMTSPDFAWSNLSWWGESWDTLFGVILFNFALVIAVPAWLSEKQPRVNVSNVIYGSSFLSTLLYLIVGILGALAMPQVSGNMLESMISGTMGNTWLQLGATLFAFMIVGLGIPLFSVLIRMNLTSGGLCSNNVGNLLGVVFPWSISWMLYRGSHITQLLAWGGVIFTSAVAFLLPLFLAHDAAAQFGIGSVSIYGEWITSKRSRLRVLKVSIGVAILSVALAIIGEIVGQNSA